MDADQRGNFQYRVNFRGENYEKVEKEVKEAIRQKQAGNSGSDKPNPGNPNSQPNNSPNNSNGSPSPSGNSTGKFVGTPLERASFETILSGYKKAHTLPTREEFNRLGDYPLFALIFLKPTEKNQALENYRAAAGDLTYQNYLDD